jgi:hypothetical protein
MFLKYSTPLSGDSCMADIAYIKYINGKYNTAEERHEAYMRYLISEAYEGFPGCSEAEAAKHAQLLAPYFQSSKEEQAKTCADLSKLDEECPPPEEWGYSRELYDMLSTQCFFEWITKGPP